jgi:hypothetical protein
VQSGSKAVVGSTSSAWGALAFHRSSAPLSTSGYTAISFYVHGGASGTRQLQVISNLQIGGRDACRLERRYRQI